MKLIYYTGNEQNTGLGLQYIHFLQTKLSISNKKHKFSIFQFKVKTKKIFFYSPLKTNFKPGCRIAEVNHLVYKPQ